MLSLCTPVTMANTPTSDPAKAVATATSNLKSEAAKQKNHACCSANQGSHGSPKETRRNFFNGHDGFARKSFWFNWNKALAFKKNGDGSSLWSTFIKALFGFHGAIRLTVKPNRRSIWSDILEAANSLKDKEHSRLYALERAKSLVWMFKLGLSSLFFSLARLSSK
ncbi:hypothetical protein Tco_0878804 [Tanacetum coccineum]|uniref:Uncharacterized protein n=1 Tax=Tanacetum coccineum TaxID=301880 RepID=A0ABQ5C240_9ASTR